MSYGRPTRPSSDSGKCPKYISDGQAGWGHYCERPIEEGTAQCKFHNSVDRKRQEKENNWKKKWDEDRAKGAVGRDLADQLKALGIDAWGGKDDISLSHESARNLLRRLEYE